jgi:hypothetical protein
MQPSLKPYQKGWTIKFSKRMGMQSRQKNYIYFLTRYALLKNKSEVDRMIDDAALEVASLRFLSLLSPAAYPFRQCKFTFGTFPTCITPLLSI